MCKSFITQRSLKKLNETNAFKKHNFKHLCETDYYTQDLSCEDLLSNPKAYSTEISNINKPIPSINMTVETEASLNKTKLESKIGRVHFRLENLEIISCTKKTINKEIQTLFPKDNNKCRTKMTTKYESLFDKIKRKSKSNFNNHYPCNSSKQDKEIFPSKNNLKLTTEFLKSLNYKKRDSIITKDYYNRAFTNEKLNKTVLSNQNRQINYSNIHKFKTTSKINNNLVSSNRKYKIQAKRKTFDFRYIRI